MSLRYIICEHLHDLYTLNSLSGWTGLTKFIPKDCLNSTLIYILFSLVICSFTGHFYRVLLMFDLVRSCLILWGSDLIRIVLDLPGLIWFDQVWSGVITDQGLIYFMICCLKDDLSRIIIIYLEMCEYLNDTLKTSEDNKKSLLKKNYLLLNCC